MMFKLAWRNLLRNFRRTGTALLTIMIGTGALFLYHGFNNGIMNQYRENTIRSRFGNGQINTAKYRQIVYERPWDHWPENSEQIISFVKNLPEVTHVFPRIEFFALLTSGKKTISGKGQGVDGVAESDFFTALNVDQGKNLTNESDGIILGQGLANALDVKVGDNLTVLANTIYGSFNGIDVVVTGIFQTGAKEFDDSVFRVPITQAQLLLDTNKVESIAVGLQSVQLWPQFAQKVKKNFPNLDLTPFEILDKVYYQNSVDFLQSQFNFILLIILVIVVMGIFNTVATGILERKREIGTLRANGESRWDVLKLLLLEGGYFGLLGPLLGIGLAFFLTNSLLADGIPMPPGPGITKQFIVKIELVPSYAFVIIALGLGCSLLASLLAALKVVGKELGDLLRSL